jgi:HSP20 family molecular chaperone IbpA
VIREFGERIERAVLEGVGRVASRYQESKPLAVDLLENDDEYLAVFDAPGAQSSDVDVRFDDRTVRVTVDRFREFHEGFELRVPGRGLTLRGEVDLPAEADVDPDAASAVLSRNGTVAVHVPKVTGKPATIEENGDGRVERDDPETTV